ncbi:antibiotic biosynthesis monooxygenase family protein [Nonomuraea sp. NPDC003804]|uniref:antibiotic biosynthesis monooxygenase family protein n=1 Tax=Nonomuraea sp. NPDC003804 TaxID=3154547 RepID=UPI0033B28B9E
MGKIVPEDDYYTLINIFTVTPGDQKRIYDVIVEATDIIQRFPGFVSANVHMSYDGTRVVNYAQWRSKEEFDLMQRHPDVQGHFKECRAVTDDINSIFCQARYTHGAE